MSEVVVVSGGSRGLGAALCGHLLATGRRVATFSRSRSPFLEEALADPSRGERLLWCGVDARDSAALRRFVAETHERFGQIDGLINNAALAYDALLAMETEEHIDEMLTINLKATLLLTKECARLMLLRRSGSIVSISSIVGQRGFRGLATYSATKAGLVGMTRSLARELGPRQIRVNVVAPGYLETDMSGDLSERERAQIIRRTPLGRLGCVEDVIPVIEFLLGPGSAYVTGQVLTVDGGGSV